MRVVITAVLVTAWALTAEPVKAQDCPGGCCRDGYCGPYGCYNPPRLAYVPYLAYVPVQPYAYRPYRDRGVDFNFRLRGGFDWPAYDWGDRDRERGRESFRYRSSWR
jgi:hypothetical protein